VTLSCQHFGVCGGCSALDTPLDAQLEAKAKQVRELVAPFLGALPLEQSPPQGRGRFYRMKLLYPVQPDALGRPTLGIYERGTHRVVRIDECQIQDRALTLIGRRAEAILRELDLEPYDETTLRGSVRAFGARIAPGSGELLLGVVTTGGLFPAGPELARRLLEAADDLPGSGGRKLRPVGVVHNLNERPGNVLIGPRSLALAGRDYQEDRQDGLVFRVSFASFYPVHRNSAEILYAPALRMLGDVRGLRVVDGYGGVGAFGLRLAAAGAAAVEIVEESPSACRDARHNAQRNGLGQVRVEQAELARAGFAERPDVLLVDPPRAGLQAAGCQRALAAAPARILHGAGAAASLARDLALLCAGGYRVRAIRLVDLFPHTEHVEVLALLSRD
jgi:23S rRNA (uracil1939-C5)-methyltransferase